MCDGLAVGGHKCENYRYGIQDFIYTFKDHFVTVDNTHDTTVLAQSIIDRLNTKLYLKASFLTNLSAVIQSECSNNIFESLTDFNNLYFSGNDDREPNLPTDMEYNIVYQDTVSITASTYKIPNGVSYDNENIQKDARMSQLLDNTMITLYNDHCVNKHEYCSMFFASINGIFRQFPGVKNSKLIDGSYKNYDPRFRPWYVSAASGNRDIVILLDISGSMRENGRIQLAQEAAISVLNTLGSGSFVNVVAFSDIIQNSCLWNQLVPATSRNVAALVNFVTDLQAGGGTDFTIAFNAAFDMLSTGKNCNKSILFLTDGISDNVYEFVKKRNIDINAVIFSYTLGSEAAQDVPKAIAELTNGIYTHVDDGDGASLITKMSSYYLYYAYGFVSEYSSKYENIIVTSPYIDPSSGISMITMAIPVYIDVKNNNKIFVGVVGTDIPLSVLSDTIGDITIGGKSYSFVMNEKSEILLHPMIPNAFELFDNTFQYKPVFVHDVEPEEFTSSLVPRWMLQGKNGMMKFSVEIEQPAWDNGYIGEYANLLYVYGPVGPTSLSIAIVITYDFHNASDIKSIPNVECNESITPDECLAPFNLFHRIDLLMQCNSSWLRDVNIINGTNIANDNKRYNKFYSRQLYSIDYPVYHLQSGLYENQYNAINTDPSCESLEELYKLTNGLGSYDMNKLPYGGFRNEVALIILNSIRAFTSLHEFWSPVFLANDSSFISMWFGQYQGLHISYPAKRFSSMYNNKLRPWYQRAIAYPDKFVWSTPYIHSVSQSLVITASTVVYADTSPTYPDKPHPYGVLGFTYEYERFVIYWRSVMNSICEYRQYCYLIDSSAFMLYYEGIEYDVNDVDISTQFFGYFEPTLMQSLLNRKLFVNDTNINFKDDTIDFAYIMDESVYNYGNFESKPTSFAYNNGRYTVHAVPKTNLYVIYIENYQLISIYPNNCPNHIQCRGVMSPGCIRTNEFGDCTSAFTDVCTQPDLIISSNNTQCSVINELGICVLTSAIESDMCAVNSIQLIEGCDDHGLPTNDTDVPTTSLVNVDHGNMLISMNAIVFLELLVAFGFQL